MACASLRRGSDFTKGVFFTLWDVVPSLLCPAGRGLLLAKVIFSTIWGGAPNPLCPPGRPPFCWQKGGKDHQRGESPLGTPTGKQTAACACAGPKNSPACATPLWLSLIKCLRRICMWSPSLLLPNGGSWHKTTGAANTLWASPGPPLRAIDLAHGKRCPKGGYPPLESPTGKRTADCGCAGPKDGPACATALWLPL